MEQTTLYYRQGGSDKVYAAFIEPCQDGHIVRFQFGRRGAATQSGQKTTAPVSYADARKVYDKLIREKLSKGYQAGESQTAYQAPPNVPASPGLLPQLLNSVEDEEAKQLIQHPHYWMQEKLDGRRLLLCLAGSVVTGLNRQGKPVAIPQCFVQSAHRCPTDFVLDGEQVGDTLHVFDLLQIGKENVQARPYHERHSLLCQVLEEITTGNNPIIPVPTYKGRRDKLAAVETIRAANKEGVVFKDRNAPYTPGRPASGGPQLKWKFWESASFIVTAHNRQRSVVLGLYRGGEPVPAGNVTIPPNHAIPNVGEVVECRYLYAFPESGIIYQPTYQGTRDDIPVEHCTPSQLKYKSG